MHLRAARLRAIETRRWLVRASNSGISAVIAPSGEVVASLAYGRRGTLLHRVGLSGEITPYVRLGDWVTGLSALLAGVWTAGQFRGRAVARRR